MASLNEETRRIIHGADAPIHVIRQLFNVMTYRRPAGREIPLEELPVSKAVRYGQTVCAEEIVFELADGHKVTTIVNATPVRSEVDEIVSVIATVQDMTPLEDLERLRSEFLGMVSHELRTPLTTIKGSAATLLAASSTLSPAEMGEFFQIIDEQADHMRSLISDLLDVSRIEAGTLSITPEPAVVAALVKQAIEAFLRDGARNSIEVGLPPDLPRIGADRQRIMQVLINLLSNASKYSYSPDQSAIRVSASLEDVYVAISVSDDGRGISAEHLPHLFRKYSRIDDEGLSRHIAGEGLGLAICRGIVEAHGGRIRADSDGPGFGTRFTFTVPTVDEASNGSATGPDLLSSESDACREVGPAFSQSTTSRRFSATLAPIHRRGECGGGLKG